MRKVPIPVSGDYRHFTNRKERAAMGPVVRKSSQKRKKGFGFLYLGSPLDSAVEEQPADA